MATTTVAMGKIMKAVHEGQPALPPGWALDARGRPTTSTEQALGGFLMPLGAYKCYACRRPHPRPAVAGVPAGVRPSRAACQRLQGFREAACIAAGLVDEHVKTGGAVS